MSGGVKLSGFGGLDRKLKKLPEDIAKKALKKAVRAGGQVILDDASRRVPVRTGRLKKSLRVKVRKSSRHGAIAKIGTNAPHAHLLEFGTVRMGARPYMRPAFDSKREAAVDEICKELKKQIRETVR